MSAAELMKRVIEYGADVKGIGDRFMGSDELYETCFMDMIDESNVSLLRKSMRDKDYKAAFEAAHALKGLSGNLGLTPYYTAICELVESLRANAPDNVEAQYAEVERRYQDLVGLLSDVEPIPPPSGAADKRADDAEKARDDAEKVSGEREAPEVPEAPERDEFGGETGKKPKKSFFVQYVAVVLVLIISVVYLLFSQLMNNYDKNVTVESASHLIEINRQFKRYFEDRIECDWMTAYTVANSIVDSNFTDDDERIIQMMRKVMSIWKTNGIILYTESGFNIDARGETESNDMASDRIYNARHYGRFMNIVESSITYTVPVDTPLTYRGSRIVAVSVVKSMETFLDDMDFSSFEGEGYIYLCDADGKVISRLTNEASKPAYNIMSLFGGEAVASITSENATSRDILTSEVPNAFIIEGNYVVSTPVITRQEPLRLVYFVPEEVVNKTMDGFSKNVTTSSMLIMFIFGACALMVFIYVYSVRKKQFDSAILAREHTFDMLVKKSRSAFGLFEINRPKPVYVSVNSRDIVGSVHPGLFKSGSRYGMRGDDGEETPIIRQINQSMSEWNGQTAFRSGFILNTETMPPNYFEIQLYPIDDEPGRFVGIAQDVTLLYEREAATKNALEMAERANLAKTRFLSNMSHDIRTPMNAIVNMADFAIEDMNDPAKLTDHLKTIRESSDHLLLLINDILDMSRIESGKAAVENAPFDIREELGRLASIVAPLCASNGLLLITDFDSVRTRMVMGDRVKVSQIIMNLLSNAVKFTPRKGAVRFTAKEAPSLRENYADMSFIIEDTGIGISKEFVPHVFEPFSREDAKRVSGVQGTGLGLSICHSYVTAMGGVIRCESEVGEGSAFTVELFFEKTRVAPERAPEAAPLSAVTPFMGKRCLLCEDNPTNQRIAKTVLERLGFAVEVANDGKEGLAKFEMSNDGYYDVIYMDIQMPVMDGYEAAAAIRLSGHPRAKRIPIVAMTANVFIEDVEKARIAGMDGHVGKPITTAALISETDMVLNKARRATI